MRRTRSARPRSLVVVAVAASMLVSVCDRSPTEPEGQPPAVGAISAPVPPAAVELAGLIQTIETWQWSPPSPDPAGIAFSESLAALLLSDSEVNETAVFQGSNVFEMRSDATLANTFSTTTYSGEPTGITLDPSSQHLFISDDNALQVFEVNPGSDGAYGTGDDVVTSFDTDAFGSNDPEGITFDTSDGSLFIVDGVNEEIYRVAPGPNGVFDGVPPAGDDVTSSFDTNALGLLDPEGIVYDAAADQLLAVGEPNNLVFRISKAGSLVGTIDIGPANADKPAGLALAPSSIDPTAVSLWIVDRGVDNDEDPTENDGRVYEMSLPSGSENAVPSVTISAPQDGVVAIEGDAIPFAGSADDAEDGDLTSSLVWVSDRDGNLGSGGSFSVSTLSVDTHVITASATDTDGAVGSAEISLTVVPAGGSSVDVQVAASADDGEESEAGQMNLTSSDLELVFSGGNQTVGMRFSNVEIPRGASITNATIQFQVDEPTTVPTSLSIQGEAADDAVAFTTQVGNISSRSRTTSSVAWLPAPWPDVGEAGPDQRTPNIASVIQEVIDRPGWSSGNALVTIITGTGERTAESFNGDAAGAPILHVDYVAGVNEAPTATDVAINGTPEVGQTLTGTYTFVDGDGDEEGTSTYRWLRDGAEIGGAVTTSYTLVGADAGALIVFEVTPVAETGASPGAPSASPAVGPVVGVNEAPTATDVAISGTPEVGQTLTGTYTFVDGDGDGEGTSTYRWLRDGAEIGGAVTTSYTLVGADAGALIVFEVTPVAETGASPGAPSASPAVGPVVGVNEAPTATDVAINGTPEVGQTLTGTYTFVDGDGDEEGTSTYRWLRDGAEIGGAVTTSYTLVGADAGALIVFEVTPVAETGASPGAPSASPAVGPVVGVNEAPTATDVAINGTPEVGQTLTGTYTFVDGDGDEEGTSTYRWLRDGAEIGGAVTTSYTLVGADEGALIVFEVTPVAETGASPGAPAASPAVGPVVGPPAAVLTVEDVSPNAAGLGVSINVTITGTGFASGASVDFENGVGPAPSVANITVLDDATMTATITTRSGGPRRDRVWDVRVTNPSGESAVLLGGFTVQP